MVLSAYFKCQSRKKAGLLTTGDVAYVCGVAPKTAAMWMDSGALPSHKIPTTSRDPDGGPPRRGQGATRLVQRADLYRFMLEHGMPTERLDTVTATILFVGGSPRRCDLLKQVMDGSIQDVIPVPDAFSCGVESHRWIVVSVIVDLAMGSLSELERLYVRPLRKKDPLVSIVGICPEGLTYAISDGREYGINTIVPHFEPELIRDALSKIARSQTDSGLRGVYARG